MPKTKIQPVMLGTLKIGDQFIHDNVLWEVLQQEYARTYAGTKLIKRPYIAGAAGDIPNE